MISERVRCRACVHYDFSKKDCDNCKFEWDEKNYWTNDEKWDIFDLDDDWEWSHIQILYRLFYKGIQCFFVDIWTDNNIAIIIGVTAFKSKVADALQIHEEVIYECADQSIMILNLYQEKQIRSEENECD